MRVWFVDRRTCLTAKSDILYCDSKIKLKKLVRWRFGYRWKTVDYSYYGIYNNIESAIKELTVRAEMKRMFRRNKIKYDKLRKGL